MRRRESQLLSRVGDRRVYFVHSYRATPSPENNDWVLATTEYGGSFISAVHKGEISATQFHPEKSGSAGLDIIESFLEAPEEPRSAYTNGELFEEWALHFGPSVKPVPVAALSYMLPAALLQPAMYKALDHAKLLPGSLAAG